MFAVVLTCAWPNRLEIDTLSMHSAEHVVATMLRNSEFKDAVI